MPRTPRMLAESWCDSLHRKHHVWSIVSSLYPRLGFLGSKCTPLPQNDWIHMSREAVQFFGLAFTFAYCEQQLPVGEITRFDSTSLEWYSLVDFMVRMQSRFLLKLEVQILFLIWSHVSLLLLWRGSIVHHLNFILHGPEHVQMCS